MLRRKEKLGTICRRLPQDFKLQITNCKDNGKDKDDAVMLLPNLAMNFSNVRTRMLEREARQSKGFEFVNLEINNVSINS